MLNMAIEAMRPRWNPGSMLPDMLSSGLRTISGQADYDDKQFKEGAALNEQALDRESRERIAEGRQDSAYDLLGMRLDAQRQNIQLKDQLRSQKLSPSEQLRFSAEVAKEKKNIQDSAFLSGRKVSEQEAEAQARANVQERVASWRLQEMERSGQGQGGNSAGAVAPGQGGPPAPGGSQGPGEQRSQGAPGPGKSMAPNGGLPSASELQRRMDSATPGNWRTWIMDPERRAALKQRVRDPDMIEAIYQQFVKQQGRLGAQ
jgi:hypothetical protein